MGLRAFWRKLFRFTTVHHWIDVREDERQTELFLCREAISNFSEAFKIQETLLPHTDMLRHLSDREYLNRKYPGAWLEFLTSQNKNMLVAEYMLSKGLINGQDILIRFGSFEDFNEFFETLDIFQELRRNVKAGKSSNWAPIN